MSTIATCKEQLINTSNIRSNYEIKVNNKKGLALNKQKKINVYNYPFTLNTTTGCLYRCPYCYLRFVEMFKRHTKFGKELYVKPWIPEKLKQELGKYRNLDQKYKRVQINPATEGYLPQLYRWFDTKNIPPINRRCLEIFKEEKEKNNSTWMLHILTKSLEIRKDIDLIADMRDQVQVELTITTIDEEKKKIFEPFAPSVKQRLKLIEELSNKGIFVRVMAMPLLGEHTDKEEIWRLARENGAKAFKSKDLNYVTIKDLELECRSKGEVVAKRSKGRNEDPNKEMLILSGEPYRDSNGKTPLIEKEMIVKPRKKVDRKNKALWRKITVQEPYMDFGYREISSLDWGDCK